MLNQFAECFRVWNPSDVCKSLLYIKFVRGLSELMLIEIHEMFNRMDIIYTIYRVLSKFMFYEIQKMFNRVFVMYKVNGMFDRVYVMYKVNGCLTECHV